MSDTSSSSHQDIHQSVPAALEWESDHHLHHIAEPDPRVHDITLDTSFCAETSFALLKLYFPMYLKGFAGLTRACILIDPSSLESFNHTYNATIPDVVRKKLNCKTVRLDLRLKPERNFIIIAPTSANEPLTSARAHSGIVLDALRSLSGVTSCSIFVAASKMASSTLQAFSKAVKSGHLKPLPYQLPSMFGGAGGKIIQFSAGANDTLPPSYDEDEYESQSISNPKKRLRQNSQGPFADRSDFILAELNELRTLVLSENKQLKERLKAMESAAEKLQGVHDLENMKLRIANSLVLSENQKLKDRVEAMEAEVERLQADHDVVSMKQDSLNDNLLEMNENLEDLTERVEFLRLCNQDNDNKTLLKDEIIDEIATRLRQD